ncbi:MAG TPA: flagellar basal body L-ring protein FlgH [Gemmatimonadaceae bacterium]|nr:flagellar basal body L-ring protein FlgH [Gemmatimonadaceae bacterium]
MNSLSGIPSAGAKRRSEEPSHANMKYLIALLFIVLGAPVLMAQSKDQPAATTRHIASWTADKREYRVGDVITVLLSEATIASATKSQSGSDQQTRKNDLGLAPPKIGTTALPSIDAAMNMDKNASSKQDGGASRAVNFKGDISVRVIAVDKSGQIQVKGAKMVDVDKNKQSLNFTGWIRPEDVSPDNVVSSQRVADATLTYQLSGDIGKTRGGLVGRILNVFWP